MNLWILIQMLRFGTRSHIRIPTAGRNHPRNSSTTNCSLETFAQRHSHERAEISQGRRFLFFFCSHQKRSVNKSTEPRATDELWLSRYFEMKFEKARSLSLSLSLFSYTCVHTDRGKKSSSPAVERWNCLRCIRLSSAKISRTCWKTNFIINRPNFLFHSFDFVRPLTS